jgi:dolichol-phosphate mannosyltransferase
MPMPPDLPVFVVIPAYRAERTLVGVLAGVPAWVSGIVVVDDASPDGTSAAARACQAGDARIRLIRHAANQGVGGAVMSGYRAALEAGAEIVVKMDSDGQMDPAYLPQLLAPLLSGRADYAKGNRFLHERELRRMPAGRRLGNLGLSFLTKLASGYWNIFDPTNGYTAVSAEALRELDFSRLAQRYFFETSLLIELGMQRRVVEDVFIPAVYAGEQSSLSEWKSLFEFPPRLLAGLFRRILYLYFVRDFTAVSLFIIAGLISTLFGLIWGGVHWWQSGVSGVPASTGTVMIAILPLIIGLELILQAVVMDIQNVPERRS